MMMIPIRKIVIRPSIDLFWIGTASVLSLFIYSVNVKEWNVDSFQACLQGYEARNVTVANNVTILEPDFTNLFVTGSSTSRQLLPTSMHALSWFIAILVIEYHLRSGYNKVSDFSFIFFTHFGAAFIWLYEFVDSIVGRDGLFLNNEIELGTNVVTISSGSSRTLKEDTTYDFVLWPDRTAFSHDFACTSSSSFVDKFLFVMYFLFSSLLLAYACSAVNEVLTSPYRKKDVRLIVPYRCGGLLCMLVDPPPSTSNSASSTVRPSSFQSTDSSDSQEGV